MKIQWSNHEEQEATWELKDEMKTKYPHMFENEGILSFEDETLLRGENVVPQPGPPNLPN